MRKTDQDNSGSAQNTAYRRAVFDRFRRSTCCIKTDCISFDITRRLRAAVLRVCREHKGASAAGRALFAKSMLQKKSSNDADRLSKYLARFDLKFDDVRMRATGRL
ncbi:hypothetical protein [Rhizobium wenxiniae]|uniref:hypothetical protein n=1 Tax=Rhizobium wenxiniae TaxID=1737357 RepID=UPI003D3496A4